MKCPRTFQIEITEDDQIKLIGAECIKGECAWWDEFAGRCALLGLAKHLAIISTDLHWLVEKMPHAGQFVK